MADREADVVGVGAGKRWPMEDEPVSKLDFTASVR